MDAVLAFFLRRTCDRELAADLTAEPFAAALSACPSTGAPHESVIVGTVTLSKATLPNGQNPKPAAG